MNWDTVPNDHRALAFINLSLLIIIMLCIVTSSVVVFLNGGGVWPDANALLPGFFISLALSLALVVVPTYVFDRKVRWLLEQVIKRDVKINMYKHWAIRQMICYMVPTILGMAGYIVFGNYLFYICIGISLLAMVLRFPSFDRLNTLASTGTFWVNAEYGEWLAAQKRIS